MGTVICNPPYGERLGTTPALIALYSVFGQRLKNEFGGWNASIFSSESTLLDCLRMRSHRQFKAKNGPLDCVQKKLSNFRTQRKCGLKIRLNLTALQR